MFRQGNILMATDFSHYALYAVRYAVALAKKYGGVVHVAHVLDTATYTLGSGHGLWLTKSDSERLMESMAQHADGRLDHLRQVIEDEGAKAEKHIVKGRPCRDIIQLAKDLDCDVIVLATHGRTGFEHVVFGSVCERVVQRSPVPVLSIKHPEHEFVDGADLSLKIARVLFPTDFSAQAGRGLEYATSMCREFGATLVLMHAAEVPLVLPEFMPDTAGAIGDEMAERAEEDLKGLAGNIEGVEVEAVVRSGIPHREIAAFVDESDVDLVVVPTHGASGGSRFFFGRVASKVVRLAKCPVLTVPPEAKAPEAE